MYKGGILLLTTVSAVKQVAMVYTTTANSFLKTKLSENARTTKIKWKTIFNLVLRTHFIHELLTVKTCTIKQHANAFA